MVKFFEVINYLVLMLLIAGQCVVGADWMIGQFIYLSANTISVVRCFVLKRPVADKVKDCSCMGITGGLISMELLGGLPI